MNTAKELKIIVDDLSEMMDVFASMDDSVLSMEYKKKILDKVEQFRKVLMETGISKDHIEV